MSHPFLYSLWSHYKLKPIFAKTEKMKSDNLNWYMTNTHTGRSSYRLRQPRQCSALGNTSRHPSSPFISDKLSHAHIFPAASQTVNMNPLMINVSKYVTNQSKTKNVYASFEQSFLKQKHWHDAFSLGHQNINNCYQNTFKNYTYTNTIFIIPMKTVLKFTLFLIFLNSKFTK